jgi:hypothetical protein
LSAGKFSRDPGLRKIGAIFVPHPELDARCDGEYRAGSTALISYALSAGIRILRAIRSTKHI